MDSYVTKYVTSVWLLYFVYVRTYTYVAMYVRMYLVGIKTHNSKSRGQDLKKKAVRDNERVSYLHIAIAPL